jgi:molecular chaperone HtpG
MPQASDQTFEFQAEIRQLLDIVVHSLYTEKEIFLRELISNASDALEKLRHLQLTEHHVYDETLPLEIHITTDPVAKTLTIADTGVGMTRDELVENLGTIAHSGSKLFSAERRTEDSSSQPLIGQFGVGFYSAFMVAKRVTVRTHSWRPEAAGQVWESDGVGTYSISESESEPRGARVTIELNEDAADFGSDWKVRSILERYSAFLSFPITLNGDRINTVEALWLRSKSETTPEQYAEFYKFQSHAHDEPRLRLHFSADAPLSINALLFVPTDNTEKQGIGRTEPGVALYSRRVLIDAKPKDFLPSWLRFLRGVVDSEDLPLNISRETPQDKSIIAKLRGVITVRFLRFLDEEATQRPETYAGFYDEFGIYLKEGAALDYSYREPLSKLLRFESSTQAAGTRTSLADYVARMAPDQTEIYYLVGANRASLERAPYLEGFRARGLEVLFCFEAVDEWVMENVHAFDGKTLVAANHADVKLPTAADEEKASDTTLSADALSTLIAWLRTVFDERVADIKASERLTESPVLAVNADRLTSPQMRRVMRSMNRPGGNAAVRVNIEINPRHPVVQRLSEKHRVDPTTAGLVAEQLLDNALLAAGLLDDPTTMVARLNTLLAHV